MNKDYKVLKYLCFNWFSTARITSKATKALLFLLLVFRQKLIAQSNVVTGFVKDENGAALKEVIVLVKGFSTGVSSDANGRFRIPLPKNSGVLVISYVGYAAQELPVIAGNIYNISLRRDANALNNVVVIGYGVARKKDVTGAVSVIDVSKQKDLPISNVSRLLVGQAPGVTVTQPTGRPTTTRDFFERLRRQRKGEPNRKKTRHTLL